MVAPNAPYAVTAQYAGSTQFAPATATLRQAMTKATTSVKAAAIPLTHGEQPDHLRRGHHRDTGELGTHHGSNVVHDHQRSGKVGDVRSERRAVGATDWGCQVGPIVQVSQ
jgi:replication-associated recombination protein RarA